MCGRARATLSAERVAAASGTSQWVHREAYVPRYNAQPGAALPCVRASDPTRGEPPDERRVESMTWGLVPSFTGPGEKPDHFRMFNARGETLREKPAFGRLLRRRRCVALIDGFYEWRREGAGRAGAKQPYYLYLRGSRGENESASCERTHDAREVRETVEIADAETNVSRRWDDATKSVSPIRVAALYDVWRRKRAPEKDADTDARDAFFDTDTDTETMTTCVLVTVDASERIAWLHDRMPAVLRSDEEMKAWLAGGDGDGDGDSSDRRPETLLRPYAAEDLAWHPVTSDVNAAGKLDHSLSDMDGEGRVGGLLLVSQFTLAADLSGGNRPSFKAAAPPTEAQALFTHLVTQARVRHANVASGRFAADTQVHLVNDGPITIPLDIS